MELSLETACPGISLMSDELAFDCLFSIFCKVPTRELEKSVNELIQILCVIRGLEVRFPACEECGGSCCCEGVEFSLWSVREGRPLASY